MATSELHTYHYVSYHYVSDLLIIITLTQSSLICIKYKSTYINKYLQYSADNISVPSIFLTTSITIHQNRAGYFIN